MSAKELKDLDYEKIVFEEAKDFKNKSGELYKRIPIKYQDSDNKITQLCLATNPLISLGIKVDDNSVPLIIDDNETKECLENILNKVKEHLSSNISEYNLTKEKINKLDIFYKDMYLYHKLFHQKV